ncbi:MAG TPA: hypothetical protein VKZ58_10665 [Longimicrobiales bacterium]|nr:hypothetical protein [Longimicrobiales bacterium]
MRCPWWLIALPVVLLAPAACEIRQTEEGQVPEVQPGELPEYQVEPRDTITIPQGQSRTGPDTGAGGQRPQPTP